MDTRNSAVVLIICLVGGVAVVSTAAVAYSRYRRGPASVLLEPVPAAPGHAAGGSRPASVRHRPVLVEDSRRIERLQVALAGVQSLLNEKTAALATREAEYRTLQRELDQYLEITSDLLGNANPSPADLAAADDPLEFLAEEDSSPEAASMPAELDRLREELEQAALMEMALELEVNELRAELDRATQQLDQYQTDAAREMTLLLQSDRTGMEAASSVFRRIGASSVGPLLPTLIDPRAEVRRWGAEVLGALGPDAREAIPLLQETLMDNDPQVRAAAERSLRSIRD